MTNGIREVLFPTIDLGALTKGVLSKAETEDQITKAVKFLVEVALLRTTNFLTKSTLDKAKEIDEHLNTLAEEYPVIVGVSQNAFGRLAKEWAEKDGDSKTLFSRLEVLVRSAMGYGVLQEWTEENLKTGRVPFGLRQDFGIRIRGQKGEFFYFLPSSWQNQVHKRIALILRDLATKATAKWKEEKGIQPKSSEPEKPATPAEDETPKEKLKRKLLEKKGTSDNKAAATQIKVVKAKIRNEEAEISLRNLKGASLTEAESVLKD